MYSLNSAGQIMYAIAAIVIFSVWYLVSYYKWWKNIYCHVEKLPGDPRYPIIGTLYIFIGLRSEDLFDFLVEFINRFDTIFRTWSGSLPEIHLVKPEHLELVLGNPSYITKGHKYIKFMPWLGTGLLTGSGTKWREHRKLITPTFHFKILENFFPVFVEKTEILLKILDDKADGEIYNVYHDITHCALDIICETAMGVNMNAMFNGNDEYIKSIYDVHEIIVWKTMHDYIPELLFKILPQGRRFRKDLRILHGFSNRIIADRKNLLRNVKSDVQERSANGNDSFYYKKRLSFLDLLLEASEGGKILSDTDIREEVDTFMFEGHDTTAAGMSWVLLLLGNHLEVQEKVYEEVRAVLQNKSTPTSIAELNELKYLERVIKESLRLYPAVPFIMRYLTEEIQIDNYKIPAGAELFLHIYKVHRSPEYYPDPERFDPNRFLPENSTTRHPYSYIPFSAGPRNCIGQKFAMYEEKTILASIVNKFKITALETMDKVKINTDIIIRPANGVPIRLEKRKLMD